MSRKCISCQKEFKSDDAYIHIKKKYCDTYFELYPNKPIKLGYCIDCYQQLLSEMESEKQSLLEHSKFLMDNSQKSTMSSTISSENMQENTTVHYDILQNTNPDYIKIFKKFHDTMNNKIIRIEKITNPKLEYLFNERSKQLHIQNIKYLFHGSSNKSYDNILVDGFDISYSLASGLLGQGIYFAENASYANDYGRNINTNIGKINHILLCKVNLGKTCLGHTGLTESPSGFDGVHSDFQTYAVFDNFQGIPEFIIYYKMDK